MVYFWPQIEKTFNLSSINGFQKPFEAHKTATGTGTTTTQLYQARAVLSKQTSRAEASKNTSVLTGYLL